MQAFDETHIPYVYAAYRRETEPHPDMPADMKVPEFTQWIINQTNMLYEAGHEVVTFIGETPRDGRIPVGVATVEYHGKIAYPHVEWFPEASPRNKLEIVLLFLLELKKHHTVMIFSRKEFEHYFNFLCTYGVIRKVGKMRDWYEDKVHAMLYQSVGH